MTTAFETFNVYENAEQLRVLRTLRTLIDPATKRLPADWNKTLPEMVCLSFHETLRLIPAGVVDGAPNRWFVTEGGWLLCEYASIIFEARTH